MGLTNWMAVPPAARLTMGHYTEVMFALWPISISRCHSFMEIISHDTLVLNT